MPCSSPETERLLRCAELTTLGRVRSASNVVLLCEIEGRPPGSDGLLCVYKPARGEQPLWDFPHGSLAGREFASYLISEALGWSLIPPTALREGPYGWGMAQQWVRSAEGAQDALVAFFAREQVPPQWRPVISGRDADGAAVVLAHADHPRLRQLAVFDVLINNADRKGGHVLLGDDGAVWGIDHGVSLHEDPKLRTVLWGWSGEPVPADQLADVARLVTGLAGPLGEALSEHVTADEVAALAERAARLLAEPVMPSPLGERVLPWPLL
jgi:uncharacterized repeat protein (TIGR03843 family)